jgi:3-hydroxyisobutyrate dehydrogenase
MTPTTEIGFIGLGTMGAPMALNLLRAGTPIIVWNRSEERRAELGVAGALVASSANEVFARCKTVIVMLADEASTDATLGRGTSEFNNSVNEHTIVAMGTMSPGYSQTLGAEIRSAGGWYVEAPVSGSRKPAESGQLVAMLAGDPESVANVKPLLAPMCRETFYCGEVPNALKMKLAVNVFLITLVTGLAEATNFAKRLDLDLERFVAILDAGPMSSDISRIKAAKLLRQDFARQAGISDVLKNSRLVVEAAREASLASPLMDICLALYGETEALGLGADDMIAVVRAIESRSPRR